MRYAFLRISLVMCLATVISLCVQAQLKIREGDPVDIKIEEIGVDQGLSQGMIHGLNVDLKGYLWIATKDGLNRYDGNHFHVFRHDPQDSNSIASNYIRSLHIDDRGLIWVGTNANGLDLYDPTLMRFIHFGPGPNTVTKSKTQSVSRIMSDPSGQVLIWDGTGTLCEMFIPGPGKDPMSIESWQIKSIKDVYQLKSELPLLHMNNMYGFGVEGELLYHDQGKVNALFSDHVKTLTPPTYNRNPTFNAGPHPNPYHYFIDNRHRLFCITSSDRVLHIWDYKSDSFRPWLQLPDGYPLEAYRIFVDQQDRIWCNGSTVPLYRLDTHLGILQRTDVTRYHFAGSSPPDFGILCEDHHRNLWPATGGYGIIKITSRNDQFSRQTFASQKNIINSVVKDGFSFRYDDQLTKTQWQKLESKFDPSVMLRLSSYIEDSSNGLWCIIMDIKGQHLLVKINREDLSFSQMPLDMCLRPNTEPSVSVMIDRKEEFWIAAECLDEKAVLIRNPTGLQEQFEFPVQVIRNEHPFITDWYVSPQNIFWIGTKQGLFYFNPATSTWKYFHVDHSQENALSHNYILSICPDPAFPDKFLWIGTDGGGLNKMDIEQETFQHYTTDDGLPNNVIYAVQSDAHHNLWLSTNMGLTRFDPATEEVWSFTAADGLPGNEFNRVEYAKDPNGRLYFGGVEGVTSFDPEVFYTASAASPIVINRLKLSNKEISYAFNDHHETGTEYHLPAPLEHLDKLTFPYTERMISLGFSLLDFTNPTGNQYRYKLEGFNNEWIEAGDLNEAVFTNLNPGVYTFLVSGRNSNNVWSEPAKLQLIIRSPWWATWWFRSFIAMIIAGGIYAIYKYRLRQAMQIQHLRNRIAADLHDEIGSTLSSISLAGTVIQHKLSTHHPEVDGLLHRINQNTQKMMEAMSDIVWAVNTKNDRFDQVMHRMKAFAIEILEPKEVMIHFDVSPGISQLHLDMQQRKNLYLLFKEVIHNAAKYAQCNNVWVTLGFAHGRLKMEIRDDGVGYEMNPEKNIMTSENDQETPVKKMGGNGIQNMYQRANELKGQLQMQSVPGDGTKVILTFPV